MTHDTHSKVKANHLKRNAYLYVRQSTLRQVFENTESTQRQYGLRQRAIALGWSEDRIIVIDTDLGQSGASAADREGFQRLVAEVGIGRAGIVLGLEVSRLARNCGNGPRQGELFWGGLQHSQVLRILHNPRYAGAFVYGRTHTRKKLDGRSIVQQVPRDQWDTLIPGVHEGYLSWDEYEQNQQRLHESAQAIGSDRRRGPPREGPALLQGMVVCGRCGDRMTVRYHSRSGQLCPAYVCQRKGHRSLPFVYLQT